jgi:hypothetical protein
MGSVGDAGNGAAIAPRMKDYLQIWLQNPPWRDTYLLCSFEHSLEIAHRLLDTCEESLIGGEAAGGTTNPGIAERHSQQIEFTARRS